MPRDDDTTDPARADGLPTLALLGEFSAGKSTLANVLLGAEQSTVRVTATQAPPIWYVFGTGLPIHISTDGTETELTSRSMGDLSLSDTRAVRVFVNADILQGMTILDMPGSSDPNMSPDVWDALLPLVDIVIWCTPSTQAWRQSEAAIWDMVPERLHQKSLLLLTRMDKVAPSSNRTRIKDRVVRETNGLFRAVLPVSLLDVGASPADCEVSGLKQVMSALSDVLNGAPVDRSAPTNDVTPVAGPSPPRPVVPRRVAVQCDQPHRRILRRHAQDGRGAP